MDEKGNVIKTVNGGFASIMSAFMIESIEHMLPWLIVTAAVILCDLICGVRKSMYFGEDIRFSSAIRKTMGKTVTYFSVCMMMAMIEVASGEVYQLDKWACFFVCFVEGCSIISNILKPKGYSINFVGLLSLFTKKHLGVEKDELGNIIKEDNAFKSKNDETTRN